MKILPITQLGNPILRKKAKPVPAKWIGTAEFLAFTEAMFRTMHAVDGIGLAAPQVGVSFRLAVIEIGPTKTRPGQKRGERIIMVNPKIMAHSKESSEDWEGCLSFEGVRGKVPRFRSVRVRYTNEAGKAIERIASGLLARAFQHEIDHLDGRAYVDRVKDTKTLITYQEFITRIVKR
jgi:peptide deformylase